MRALVDAITIVAFLSAPLFAYLNCRVLTSADSPLAAVPPGWLRVLSWGGVIFLTGFSIVFLVMRFGKQFAAA